VLRIASGGAHFKYAVGTRFPTGGPSCKKRPFKSDIRKMQRKTPPFRADHVGSILRTAPLKEARAKRENGEITAAQFQEVEQQEIKKIIKKQEDIGLLLATDGEFPRSWWHFDFLGLLTGAELYNT